MHHITYNRLVYLVWVQETRQVQLQQQVDCPRSCLWLLNLCVTHPCESVMDSACSLLRSSAQAAFTTAVMVCVLDKLFLLLVIICC